VPPALHAFPTRRSSDLRAFTAAKSLCSIPSKLPAHASVICTPLSFFTMSAVSLQGGRRNGQEPRWTLVSVITASTPSPARWASRSEEHTSELQSPYDLV